jgi:hypothetical protein
VENFEETLERFKGMRSLKTQSSGDTIGRNVSHFRYHILGFISAVESLDKTSTAVSLLSPFACSFQLLAIQWTVPIICPKRSWWIGTFLGGLPNEHFSVPVAFNARFRSTSWFNRCSYFHLI